MDEEVECPMCGRRHRVIRDEQQNNPNNNNETFWQTAREAFVNAGQAGRNVTGAVNGGLNVAGFQNGGIARNSLASGLQSRMGGTVARGSAFSRAQSLGARGGASNTGYLAMGAAALALGATVGRAAWDWYQDSRQRNDEQRRNEWNLCPECWAVAREALQN